MVSAAEILGWKQIFLHGTPPSPHKPDGSEKPAMKRRPELGMKTCNEQQDNRTNETLPARFQLFLSAESLKKETLRGEIC